MAYPQLPLEDYTGGPPAADPDFSDQVDRLLAQQARAKPAGSIRSADPAHPSNLPAILRFVREIAQAQSEAPGIPNQFMGAAIKMLVGEKPETIEKWEAGFPPWTGTGETLHPTSGGTDILTSLPFSPTAGVSKLASVLLSKEAMPAIGLLGSIGKKGLDPYMMHRGGGLLEDRTTGLTREHLSSPSYGITGPESVVSSFVEDPSGSNLIVRQNAGIDPAVAFDIANRDIYVPRAWRYPGGQDPGPVLAARQQIMQPKRKKESRPGWYDPASAEYPEYQPFGAHETAIMMSPHFQTLDEYLKSPKGAGTLGTGRGPRDSSSMFYNDFTEWANRNSKYLDEGMDWRQALITASREGDPEAKKLLWRVQTLPSGYGEVKVSGPVPLTGENFAGILLRGDPNNDQIRRLARVMEIRGIPASMETGTGLGDYLKALDFQNRAGPRQDVGWEGLSLGFHRRIPEEVHMKRFGTQDIDPQLAPPPAKGPTIEQMENGEWLTQTPGLWSEATNAHAALELANKNKTGAASDSWLFHHGDNWYKVETDGTVKIEHSTIPGLYNELGSIKPPGLGASVSQAQELPADIVAEAKKIHDFMNLGSPNSIWHQQKDVELPLGGAAEGYHVNYAGDILHAGDKVGSVHPVVADLAKDYDAGKISLVAAHDALQKKYEATLTGGPALSDGELELITKMVNKYAGPVKLGSAELAPSFTHYPSLEAASEAAHKAGNEKFYYKGTNYGIYSDEHGSSVWNADQAKGKPDYEIKPKSPHTENLLTPGTGLMVKAYEGVAKAQTTGHTENTFLHAKHMFKVTTDFKVYVSKDGKWEFYGNMP